MLDVVAMLIILTICIFPVLFDYVEHRMRIRKMRKIAAARDAAASCAKD